MPDAVSHVVIEPQQATFHVGDVINCTADGNPAATVTWTAVAPVGMSPVYGEQLDVTVAMAGYNSWNCTAINNVADSIAIVSSVDFMVGTY